MKIKFQPPSATDLPPHNPILPPAAITQVILLANPNKVTLFFIFFKLPLVTGEILFIYSECEDCVF